MEGRRKEVAGEGRRHDVVDWREGGRIVSFDEKTGEWARRQMGRSTATHRSGIRLVARTSVSSLVPLVQMLSLQQLCLTALILLLLATGMRLGF